MTLRHTRDFSALRGAIHGGRLRLEPERRFERGHVTPPEDWPERKAAVDAVFPVHDRPGRWKIDPCAAGADALPDALERLFGSLGRTY